VKTEKKPPLSRREREVMDVLYRLGEATVAEVMEEMPNPLRIPPSGRCSGFWRKRGTYPIGRMDPATYMHRR